METELIEWLRNRVPGGRRLLVGLGDDAAVLDWTSRPDCVVTVDMLMDGVDFRLGEVDPRRVGHKSLAVNLSDLAAMAARPVAGVIALALPRDGGQRLAKEIYEGLLPLAERFDMVIAGGDINSWNAPLAISITLLGESNPRGPLRRDGARPGDVVVVTGSFGGSLLGRHLDVEPRVDEAGLLHERYELHAGIDVSDGLALDLSRLATASGCGALVRTEQIPIADAAHQRAAQGAGRQSALEHALHDGEDFELILAVPPDEAARLVAEQPLPISLTAIGEFTTERGMRQIDAKGNERPLAARGYEHALDD